MAETMAALSGLFSLGLLLATLRMATPLIFGAIGCMFSERSGVMNIGAEGMMLMGAFAAALTSLFTGNPWLGVLAAAIAGGFMGTLHAIMSIHFRADQVVSGAAINIMAVGVPALVLQRLWGNPGRSPLVPSLPEITIPGLKEVPVLGALLGTHNPLVYLALLLVPLAHIVLFKTRFGLHVRVVGEHPRAADTVGINVFAIRYVCVILSGVLAGLGGAYLSLGQLSLFVQQMTAGRGFIGMAAMIFGKWTPLGAFLACLLFGFADGLQMTAQAIGIPIPKNFLLMIPYVLTMVALAGFIGRAMPPAAIGKPYRKE
ncbi:Branched-chain amino acid transport system / permease component [Neomoorella glycerini]|uniref:Branched-chain amino acid transport system / permease component n=1 Tax=Neomoorella glycerini TaxID=55779 RepID=A0A6I5ZT75_9FIRM|nr:ABC transporter permease [Moorella glycerini]QGP93124.1 Branched-chain amino acid transport system / permease component [Moorella glycerini]